MPKLQRWVDLLAALLSRRFPVTLDELRREVPAYGRDVPAASLERMFERDKRELREFGIPIETVTMNADDQGAVGYQLRTRDFYLPFITLAGEAPAARSGARGRGSYASLPTLTFEPDELSAITAAAARMRDLGDPHLIADIDSAMRKLALGLSLDAAHERQAPDSERVVASPVDARTFAALGAALKARKLVEFEYHKMGDDSRSRRAVEPYGLVFQGSHWYLIARDRGHRELRHFRLGRMRDIEVNKRQASTPDFTVPPEFDLAEHARSRASWQLGDGDAVEAVIEFRGTGGEVKAAAKLGEAVKGSPRRRRFRVRRGDAFARWLLSFGGDAMPVAPPGLVSRFRELATATLAVYGGPEQ